MQNTYETLILVASGARHDKENIFAKFKRQNCGETLAHDSCVFLQSQRLDSGVSSHSLQYGTEVLPHHLAICTPPHGVCPLHCPLCPYHQPLLWEASSVMGCLVQVSYLRNLSYPGQGLLENRP